jgi:hypothetical protein
MCAIPLPYYALIIPIFQSDLILMVLQSLHLQKPVFNGAVQAMRHTSHLLHRLRSHGRLHALAVVTIEIQLRNGLQIVSSIPIYFRAALKIPSAAQSS